MVVTDSVEIRSKMRIDEVLLKRGLVDQEQLVIAQEKAQGQRIDRVLVELGFVSEEDVLPVLADELGMQRVDLRDFSIDRDLLDEFPTAAVFRHTLLPLERRQGRVLVATSDPFDLDGLDELGSLSGHQLEAVLARRDDIVQRIKENLGVGGDTIDQLVAQTSSEVGEESHGDFADADELTELAQTASVVRLVNELLVEALQQNASDIHIEPQERGLTIRYRIDGMLWVQPVPSEIRQFYAAIVTRLKIMARLNIAEKRLPQDGRMKLRVAGREIDVRVSILPAIYGEGIVLRLLDKARMVFDLNDLGMPPDLAGRFRQLISVPYGIVLVTGPTGHGKTTTLYSAINEIRDTATKIITVEDPVEYQTDGITQIQVHTRIGLTFASGLRSILRHDPDVILIGEIRDRETAEIAIQSALTGHLVFSTLHSNDAAGAFTRLIDMGIEPYLVASSVVGVLAQRLVRVLCPECKQEYSPQPQDIPEDYPQPHPRSLWKPSGCRTCRQTGFCGRTGVFELLAAGIEARRLVVERATSAQIREYAIGHGLATLRQCGWQKATGGVTSVDEVLRITKGDLIY